IGGRRLTRRRRLDGLRGADRDPGEDRARPENEEDDGERREHPGVRMPCHERGETARAARAAVATARRVLAAPSAATARSASAARGILDRGAASGRAAAPPRGGLRLTGGASRQRLLVTHPPMISARARRR